MLTLKEYENQIKSFQDKFGTEIIKGEQGSLAWLQTRLGVITASEVSDAVAGIKTKTRNTYLCKLVAEVASGMIEEINSKYLEWGKMNEAAARATYEFGNDVRIEQVPFLFRDDSFREGVSLDGLILEGGKTVEIKCPYNTTNFIKFLVNDDIKKEWDLQCQYQMRVTGAESAVIIQYDPRMVVSPFKALEFERDEKIQKMFDETIPQFILDMDTMLEMVGVKFGDQWKRLAAKDAAQSA